MAKKYFILENIVLWGGVFIIAIYGICLQILIFELQKSACIMKYIIIMVISGGLYCSFMRYVKKLGFGKMLITPHIYKINIRYNDILNAFMKTFSTVYIFDDNSAYVLGKKRGVRLRINIIKFDDFSRDALRKRKKTLNANINKRHDIANTSTLANSYNKVRINLIVVKNIDEYCKEIVYCNASRLFSRIECVLNVVLSEESGEVFIPAHFGVSKMNEYYKTFKLLKQVLGWS